MLVPSAIICSLGRAACLIWKGHLINRTRLTKRRRLVNRSTLPETGNAAAIRGALRTSTAADPANLKAALAPFVSRERRVAPCSFHAHSSRWTSPRQIGTSGPRSKPKLSLAVRPAGRIVPSDRLAATTEAASFQQNQTTAQRRRAT
jgi:hypothetical protein